MNIEDTNVSIENSGMAGNSLRTVRESKAFGDLAVLSPVELSKEQTRNQLLTGQEDMLRWVSQTPLTIDRTKSSEFALEFG